MKRVVLIDRKTNVHYYYNDSMTAAKAIGKSYVYIRALLKGKLTDPTWIVAYENEDKETKPTKEPEQSTLQSVIEEFFNS